VARDIIIAKTQPLQKFSSHIFVFVNNNAKKQAGNIIYFPPF